MEYIIDHFLLQGVKRSVMKTALIFLEFVSKWLFLASCRLSKIRILQSNEVLWIHVIYAICRWTWHEREGGKNDADAPWFRKMPPFLPPEKSQGIARKYAKENCQSAYLCIRMNVSFINPTDKLSTWQGSEFSSEILARKILGSRNTYCLKINVKW